MPKFLITIFLIILSSFSSLLCLFFKVHPTNRLAIPAFLLCLFTTVTFTSTTVIFALAKKERRVARDTKTVFRAKLKKGLFFSAVITLAATIKILISS